MKIAEQTFKTKFKIFKIRFAEFKVKHRKKLRIIVIAAITALFLIFRSYEFAGFIYLSFIYLYANEIKH